MNSLWNFVCKCPSQYSETRHGCRKLSRMDGRMELHIIGRSDLDLNEARKPYIRITNFLILASHHLFSKELFPGQL